jgi:hypothetical protein
MKINPINGLRVCAMISLMLSINALKLLINLVFVLDTIQTIS